MLSVHFFSRDHSKAQLLVHPKKVKAIPGFNYFSIPDPHTCHACKMNISSVGCNAIDYAACSFKSGFRKYIIDFDVNCRKLLSEALIKDLEARWSRFVDTFNTMYNCIFVQQFINCM